MEFTTTASATHPDDPTSFLAVHVEPPEHHPGTTRLEVAGHPAERTEQPAPALYVFIDPDHMLVFTFGGPVGIDMNDLIAVAAGCQRNA